MGTSLRDDAVSIVDISESCASVTESANSIRGPIIRTSTVRGAITAERAAQHSQHSNEQVTHAEGSLRSPLVVLPQVPVTESVDPQRFVPMDKSHTASDAEEKSNGISSQNMKVLAGENRSDDVNKNRVENPEWTESKQKIVLIASEHESNLSKNEFASDKISTGSVLNMMENESGAAVRNALMRRGISCSEKVSRFIENNQELHSRFLENEDALIKMVQSLLELGFPT